MRNTRTFAPLRFQLIYGGKTTRSLPPVSFPESFSLSVNPKHFSNTNEVIKHIKEIVVPYVNQQRKELQLPDQPALLIMDAFRGQLTDPVTTTLKENHIYVVFVPNNMTDLFQPLDLTTNKWVKNFMKKKFCDWFTCQLREGLKKGQPLEEIDIKFQLTTLKPLHATWLIDCYNKLSSNEGKEVILSGWRSSGIADAIEMGSAGLPSLDPYLEIDQLCESYEIDQGISNDNPDEFLAEEEENHPSDSDSEWELDMDGNAFALFE